MLEFSQSSLPRSLHSFSLSTDHHIAAFLDFPSLSLSLSLHRYSYKLGAFASKECKLIKRKNPQASHSTHNPQNMRSTVSKIVVFIFLAMVLHVSTQVAAATLATGKKNKDFMGIHRDYRCPFGCCGRVRGVYCYCCVYPREKAP